MKEELKRILYENPNLGDFGIKLRNKYPKLTMNNREYIPNRDFPNDYSLGKFVQEYILEIN